MSSTAQLDLRALDQIRQRIQQLANSTGSLSRDLENSDPFPTWSALQTSFILLTHQITELQNLLDTNEALLSSAHVYPLPDFPDLSHTALLDTLLRKRLEPKVESWIDEGRRRGDAAVSDADTTYDAAQLEELWDWAAVKVRECLGEVVWNIDYTMEERAREGGVEGVETGIKRALKSKGDEEESEESDEDEEDEGGDRKMKEVAEEKPVAKAVDQRPALQLEDLYRFMSTGRMPKSAPAGG